MSTTKPFSSWIDSKYPKKAASIKNEISKQKIKPVKFEIQKKKELIKKLITQANEGEKFVEIGEIAKKVSKRKDLLGLEWLDKKDIVIDNILDNQYEVLEDYYDEKGKIKMKDYHKQRFESYKDNIEDEDAETINKVKDIIELTIVNNSK